MSDKGLTHVALAVSNLDASIAFYGRYAQMQVVHRRKDPVNGTPVAWITDQTRPFVIVLIEQPPVKHPLLPPSHLGVACGSREEVRHLCDQAREEGCLKAGPDDYGPPVGYWAFLSDPDGHILELSHGQEVAYTVEQSQTASHS
ncbi:VOC family protein [Gloeobacter kilaueensis]|uniref:Glyoxalase/bleomycin resistance protein/dioxygenase n=1 Tax=Gloeobacter kilaueensis (strain ATCC BAA-2537 / CCAP 1431/1 / ULC 316 / JS1) TaxID=1183438 RepID=U5QQF9_GLOK1|nr:VOC family protein [Gloeobacter kilaueensis]AGY59844.1 glyoxalase/bleomycin resistance protein/dioxygenase [Gloeobacter kilaueensis JS1]